MWFGSKPNLSNVKLFGSEVYVKKLGNLKKLDSKSEKYSLIGYSGNGYRLWDMQKRRIIIARDVVFTGKLTNEMTSVIQPRYREDLDSEIEESQDTKMELDTHDKPQNSTNSKYMLRNRENINRPERLKDYEVLNSVSEEIGLLTYNEAVTGVDKENWVKAIQEEKDSLKKNETWDFVNTEEVKGKKILSSRWIFKIKDVTEMEDQRICIKFCVKKEFKGAEILWMLQTAYGDAVMSRRRVFEWYKRFKEGREETTDKERSGRPSTSTTPEKVDKVLELNARKETVSLNLEATTDDPELLKRVITGDETWIYGFDSKTTQQASEWRLKMSRDQRNPELAPCDFFLFGKLKKKRLKGRKFQSIEEIKVESKKAMKAIPKTDYQRCFADWKKKVAKVHRGQRGLL
ncbi:hypothetical protein LAZ67_8003259 [Cordylochernes scorpioides]|uniref:Mos1 transposase HTH domain-containing protein n=1 Tax=Cordylochernes scorpioides TaxID=51811 RepID=A0ABY6KRY6_9ARAC|nr:hypothetical protein LAZ67_8003259 [Cordylochernes scorpioides]